MVLTINTAEQLSKLPFLEEISLLKLEADSFKPLPNDTENRILQKFRLDWNYHSNAIEGNKLTYGETVAFIMEGVTAKGKTLKDHLDIKGHDEAVKYLIHLVKEPGYMLTEADIRNLHQIILKEPYFSPAVTPSGEATRKEIKIGQYKSGPNHVKTATGEIHYYATPEDTPIKMGELMAFYKAAKENSNIHPLVLATLFHHEFTNIHPFDDGNGRMARLLMNLMLMQEGYPPVVVKQEDRISYYQVLRQADAGEVIPLTEYMAALLKHALTIYIAGAKGESIEEEDDIDKEIALFKKSLDKDKVSFRKNAQIVKETLTESVLPIFNLLFKKLSKFNDLFVEVKKVIQITEPDYFEKLELLTNDVVEPDEIFMKMEYKYNYFRYESFGDLPDIGYNFTSFIIIISFTGYKKSAPHFSENLVYNVRFDEYYYSISRENRSGNLLYQPYGTPISKEAITEFGNGEAKYFLEIIKRHLA